MDSIVTYAAVLDVAEDTVFFLARLLWLRRAELGTRRGRRSLGCYRQAVLVIRWFLDGTRIAQLAGRQRHREARPRTATSTRASTRSPRRPGAGRGNGRGQSRRSRTSEPGRHGDGHRPLRRTPGPTVRNCGGPASTNTTAGTSRCCPIPTAGRSGISGVRPGREHDTTCAKAAAGLMPALEQAAAEDMPTLTDLGYEGLAGPALRMPVKKVKGTELSDAPKAVQPDRPWCPRRRRARELPAEDHLQGPATRQRLPVADRRDRQGRTRPPPPRTRPPPTQPVTQRETHYREWLS